MGQKVNSIGFRLGINNEWQSEWCSKIGYTSNLQSDLVIQKYIKTCFWKKKKLINQLTTTRCAEEIYIYLLVFDLTVVNIFKKINKYKKNRFLLKNLKIIINLIGKLNGNIPTKWSIVCINKLLSKEKNNLLKKKLKKYKKNLHYKLVLLLLEASSLFKDAKLLSNLIRIGLERTTKEKHYHKKFLKLIQNGLKLICKKNILGIKYQVNGRLDGIDRSRCIRFQQGKISLSSFISNISFNLITANTRYGCFGIKVWICYKC